MSFRTMKSRSLISAACLCAALFAGSAFASEPPPSLSSPDLGQGPYSAMHMLLEKTFLKVDVLTVDVKFGKDTQARLAELARGKQYSDGLAKQVADVAIRSEDAVVQLKFLRNVSLDQWMDAVRDNLKQARAAGLITAKVEERVNQALPNAFAAVRERGYKKGDRVLYRLRPDSLRTVVVTADGKVLLDQTERDKEARHVVLASYFAPESDFRELLLKSLFKPAS